MQSEGYTTKKNAVNGIISVQENSESTTNFLKKVSHDGHPYFVLKSQNNGQTIGKSEMYNSSAARDNGILSVITNAWTDEIEEVS